jgi:hypothetical protein
LAQQVTKCCGTAGEFTRKDVVYFLDNRDDPDVDAGISAHLRAQYAKAEKGTLSTAAPVSDNLQLTAQVERKYIAAQIIESSIQVTAGLPSSRCPTDML